MLRSVRYLVVSMLCAVAGVSPVAAQTSCEATWPAKIPTCSRTSTAVAVVPQILRLELSTLTTAMAAPEVPQFDSSRVARSLDQLPLTTGPLVTVKSNRAWNLKIEPAAPSFDFTPDAVYLVKRAGGKPATDVAWSTAPSSGFVPLSASTPADVSSNPAGGSYAQFTMYYRTKWEYSTDAPGTYALAISYTLTGQ
jgi:hypothetical protein